MDFLSLKSFLLFSFLLFIQLLPLIQSSANSSGSGRGRNSNTDGTGASSSGRAGQSSSNYLIPITVTRFKTSKPENQNIREQVFNKYSTTPVAIYNTAVDCATYMKVLINQGSNKIPKECIGILDKFLTKEGKSKNLRRVKKNKMLDDDSAAQIIYDYFMENINQIIDEIESKAK
uniref:Uncharacterized protein n=1 Tax=Meloidogyne floridensis TaxID=298350 RepID=A0A915NHV1_9BILA